MRALIYSTLFLVLGTSLSGNQYGVATAESVRKPWGRNAELSQCFLTVDLDTKPTKEFNRQEVARLVSKFFPGASSDIDLSNLSEYPEWFKIPLDELTQNDPCVALMRNDPAKLEQGMLRFKNTAENDLKDDPSLRTTWLVRMTNLLTAAVKFQDIKLVQNIGKMIDNDTKRNTPLFLALIQALKCDDDCNWSIARTIMDQFHIPPWGIVQEDEYDTIRRYIDMLEYSHVNTEKLANLLQVPSENLPMFNDDDKSAVLQFTLSTPRS
ncbi:hypothetical protein IWQ62_001380 [Dispira parvispora]|uniref:Uncharacterized protein n=1 Tax=Dispira parvispora TaxID=1520584 RepID=A0A9W8ASP2_9FUNG|nr:hypothetical protein IWQ62_001380 [Dispira parvispora]